MGDEKTMINSIYVSQKPWYRVGSIAALVLGLGYLVIFPLYAHVGAPPNGGEAWFTYLPGKTAAWWAILALSVFTDFLFVPVAFALYLALKRVDRNTMLLATAFVGLFVVVLVGVRVGLFVMLRGAFNRITAWLGLATGILGIVSLTGFSPAIIGNAVFATAWLFFVSYGLNRLARE